MKSSDSDNEKSEEKEDGEVSDRPRWEGYRKVPFTGMFPVGDTSCRTLIAVCVSVCVCVCVCVCLSADISLNCAKND